MFKKSLIITAVLGLAVFAQSASASYIAKPGDLLRTADDATVVLVMDDMTRLPIAADAFKVRYNNNFALIKTVTTAERGTYNSNGALTLGSLNSLPSGTVFLYDNNQPGIFVVDNGFKRLFSTLSGFQAGGYNLNNVQWVGQYTLYPTGVSVQ